MFSLDKLSLPLLCDQNNPMIEIRIYAIKYMYAIKYAIKYAINSIQISIWVGLHADNLGLVVQWLAMFSLDKLLLPLNCDQNNPNNEELEICNQIHVCYQICNQINLSINTG